MGIVSHACDNTLHFPNTNFDVRGFSQQPFAETLATYKTREHFARCFQIRVVNHGYVSADTFQEDVNLGRVEFGRRVYNAVYHFAEIKERRKKKAASSNRVWY